MKTVYLMRHAKAGWADSTTGDHDRPLNDRGRRAAKQLGAYMSGHDLRPQIALVSDAIRTRETWQILSQEAELTTDVEYMGDLYLAHADFYLELIRNLDHSISSVFLLGHSPGIEVAARGLATSGPEAERTALQGEYHSGTMTEITLHHGWSRASEGGELKRLIDPSQLASKKT